MDSNRILLQTSNAIRSRVCLYLPRDTCALLVEQSALVLYPLGPLFQPRQSRVHDLVLSPLPSVNTGKEDQALVLGEDEMDAL